MVMLLIRGVEVDFPYDPYPCQVDYMSSVIACLQNGEHALLESPTGTGKTLCLLCATLAWQQAIKAKHQFELRGSSSTPPSSDPHTLGVALAKAAGTWSNAHTAPPKIIFSSRTHSQLSQAVRELNRTVYRPKVTVLGARDQMCIHPEVSRLEDNNAKLHVCRAKVAARTCQFYLALDTCKTTIGGVSSFLPDTGVASDIEDLVVAGKSRAFCPYYMARKLQDQAEILFMPYNYIIDRRNRKANDVDLTNSIVIIDEAHNIERACEESASCELSMINLAGCIQDLGSCIQMLNDNQSQDESAQPEVAGVTARSKISVEDLLLLKSSFLKFESEIASLQLVEEKHTTTGRRKTILSPSDLLLILERAKISISTKAAMLSCLEQAQMIRAVEKAGPFSSAFSSSTQAVVDFIEAVVPSDSQGSASTAMDCSYKVCVFEETAPAAASRRPLDAWAQKGSGPSSNRTVCYWCFSPGLAMRELRTANVRCFVLTSGTLAPISSFRSELQLDFGVLLENPHIISQSQVFAAVLKQGPDSTVYNSSYSNRNSESYMRGLGQGLLNVARVIPKGLLVFFPSYSVMSKCIEFWQTEGTWTRLALIKALHIEPQGKSMFLRTMETYYSDLQKVGGAAFFAVCRGKVSEGLDFSDDKGRAVVITGLPYPPKYDTRVDMKMKYLDSKASNSVQEIRGNDWYRLQAFRAINQAVGRVIRHKNDYGAILLWDERFASLDAQTSLPSWMRPLVKVYDSYGNFTRDMVLFFKKNAPTGGSKQATHTGNPDGCPGLVSSRGVDHGVGPPPCKQPFLVSDRCCADEAKVTLSYNHSLAQTPYSLVELAGVPKPSVLSLLYRTDKEVQPVEEVVSSADRSPAQTVLFPSQAHVMRKYKITSKARSHNSSEQAGAKSFLATLKTGLGKECFDQFVMSLANYKAVGDLGLLLARLQTIFPKSQRDMYFGLKSYLKSKDKQAYEDFLQVFLPKPGGGADDGSPTTTTTPTLCVRQPEHQIPDTVSTTDLPVQTFQLRKCNLEKLLSGLRQDCQSLHSTFCQYFSDGNLSSLIQMLHRHQPIQRSVLAELEAVIAPADRDGYQSYVESVSMPTEISPMRACTITPLTTAQTPTLQCSTHTGPANPRTSGVSNMSALDKPSIIPSTSAHAPISSSVGYQCAVCGCSPPHSPSQPPCGHTACSRCLYGLKACPKCKTLIRGRQLQRLYFFSSANESSS